MPAPSHVFALQRAPLRSIARKPEKNWKNEYPALTYRWMFAGNACYEVLAPAVTRWLWFFRAWVKRRNVVADGDFHSYFFVTAFYPFSSFATVNEDFSRESLLESGMLRWKGRA